MSLTSSLSSGWKEVTPLVSTRSGTDKLPCLLFSSILIWPPKSGMVTFLFRMIAHNRVTDIIMGSVSSVSILGAVGRNSLLSSLSGPQLCLVKNPALCFNANKTQCVQYLIPN